MANENMREHWSNATGEAWVDQQRAFDSVFAPFADAVVERFGPQPGDRVLDIGCGTGALTELLCANGADAVGVDISPLMVDAAARRVAGAEFRVADAQTDDLGTDLDGVVSRFGIMFFDDPVAAFANLRGATRPGGRLAAVAWRGLDENPIFGLGTAKLVERLDPPPAPPAPGKPGPLGLADPGATRSILELAGWSEVAIEPFDAVCDFGFEGSDGVDERLAMVIDGTTGRMARQQITDADGPAAWAATVEQIRADLRANLDAETLRFNGATWIVSATNPTG